MQQPRWFGAVSFATGTVAFAVFVLNVIWWVTAQYQERGEAERAEQVRQSMRSVASAELKVPFVGFSEDAPYQCRAVGATARAAGLPAEIPAPSAESAPSDAGANHENDSIVDEANDPNEVVGRTAEQIRNLADVLKNAGPDLEECAKDHFHWSWDQVHAAYGNPNYCEPGEFYYQFARGERGIRFNFEQGYVVGVLPLSPTWTAPSEND